MGGPDVGRNEEDIWTSLQADLQQVAAIQSQDRPAVGVEVADSCQSVVELINGGEVWQRHDVVNFARAAVLLVDGADLHGEEKAHLTAARWIELVFDCAGQIRSETKDAILGRLQFLLDLSEPFRMREVGGANKVDALERRPSMQVFRGQVAAGRAGMTRVEMNIGDE